MKRGLIILISSIIVLFILGYVLYNFSYEDDYDESFKDRMNISGEENQSDLVEINETIENETVSISDEPVISSYPKGMSFQWQLSDEIDTSYKAQVYDVDLFDVDASVIADLNSKGIKTICYFSVGSYEDWREDKDDFPKESIGSVYGGWAGEWFIDIRDQRIRDIMTKRMDLCKEKGFDGMEPDNMDVYGEGSGSGFPLTEQDGIDFAIWMAQEAHKRGLSIGQKNAPEITQEIHEYYDWALTEDCYEQGWCDDMLIYAQNNKAVFMTEYTDETSSSEFQNSACAWKDKGFTPILKDRMLSAPIELCN